MYPDDISLERVYEFNVWKTATSATETYRVSSNIKRLVVGCPDTVNPITGDFYCPD